ncbi:rod shape-determining protein [Actinoplanes sp. NPDC049802]|uniref:rod shape-determining protein n=1 Tax=Actinoplanes sp. NPDC049802 TaxID=3154742 RepID=UPI0033E84EAA
MSVDTRDPAPFRVRRTSPVAFAVDLGSSTAAVWAADRGVVTGPTARASGGALIRRGRVADLDGCVTLLTELINRYPDPAPVADVVVACRPVLSTEAEQTLMRQVIDSAFAPRRTLFIDTVRAAAIGAGAVAGSLLVVDLGAEITETALLEQGRVTAARRADIGTHDLGSGSGLDRLTGVVAAHVDDLRAVSGDEAMGEATARGLLLVGDGALHADLPAALEHALDLRVHRAADPCAAALNGAGRAALSALRHPGFR